MALRPVYRPILRKNERQGTAVFDVLACDHAVLVDASARANTYRRARACPECAEFVARFVAQSVGPAPAAPAEERPPRGRRAAPPRKAPKKRR